MNLFANIFDQFTGKKEAQLPSFGTPQAPRTNSYVPPNVAFGQPVQQSGGGATMQQRPINTSLPMGIAEPKLPLDNGFDSRSREERPVYNFLQGVADVVTSLPSRFEETVQKDKTTYEQEISKKRQTFISDMLAKGYKKESIFEALDSLKAKGEFDFKPGISESIVGGMGTRLQSNIDTTERLSKIQDPLERTLAGVIPYAGQTVATALQPVTSALEPFVSPVVQAVIKKTGQTENIQALSEGWNEFEKTNPILAENIAGLLNVSQLAPLPFAKPVGNAIKTGTVETGKAIVRGAEIVAPKVVQGVKTGVRATEEGIGKVTKSIVSQQSGLGTPAIESILKRPELQGKIRSGELSGAKTLEEARSSIDALREGYRETGKMYDTVRKSNVKVGTSEAKQVLLSQLESEGLATGGKLNLVDLPVKDRGAITQALKYIDEYKGEMTPQSALSIRQKLDDLINYKSDVGSNGQRIVQGLRTKYDEFLGSKLPGLKEIDAKYAPERQFWESIRKDIYKADGTLKDNALSVVSNITNKGNEARLARMESILPGIGEKVKALKAFDDIQAASGIKVGTYGRAATTGAIALVNIPLAIASWVVTHPVVVARVLESIGLASQKIKSILAKGKNITKEDATIIQQAVAKTPKSKVESIINNLSYDPKTSKLTSKTLIKNANNSVRPVAISNKGDVRKVEQVKTIVKPNTIKNESKVNKPVSSDTIPEGYFKNAFGEIQKNPSNKKGGFIKIPEIGKKVEPLSDKIKKGKVIGEGSDRKVIDLLNGTVVKIPKNERGIMQMDVNYNDLSNKGLIPKVIEKGKGYVIFEKVDNGGKLVDSMLKEIDSTNYDRKKIQSILNNYGYKIDSLDGITINELLNKNNWGLKNGKPIIIDEGIFNNERIFNKGRNLSEIEENIKYIKGKQKEFKDFQKLDIYNQSKSIVKNPLVEEAKKPKSIIKK